MMPPDNAITSAWLAFLTPIAVALLAVVHLITAKQAAARGARIEAAATQAADVSERTHAIVKASLEAPLSALKS